MDGIIEMMISKQPKVEWFIVNWRGFNVYRCIWGRLVFDVDK